MSFIIFVSLILIIVPAWWWLCGKFAEGERDADEVQLLTFLLPVVMPLFFVGAYMLYLMIGANYWF